MKWRLFFHISPIFPLGLLVVGFVMKESQAWLTKYRGVAGVGGMVRSPSTDDHHAATRSLINDEPISPSNGAPSSAIADVK